MLEQQAEAKAMAADDHNHAGQRACNTGWIHSLRGQADEVLACAKRAAAHWQFAQAGAKERGYAIRLRGMGHELKGDPAAIAAYREALELFRSLSAESIDVSGALSSLADVERRGGDIAAAERGYREALRVARAISHHEGVATYTGNLAALALDRKDWSEAETLAWEALRLSEQVGRKELIAGNCLRLAQALVRQGKDSALPHAQRAVDIYTQLGSPKLEAARAILRECES